MNDETAPVTEPLLAAARVRAAKWRLAGIGNDFNQPVRPPGAGVLLWSYLGPQWGRPLQGDTAGYRLFRSRIRRLVLRLLYLDDIDGLAARVERSEQYTLLLGEAVCRTLNRLDVELAELRARLGALEDGI